MQATLEMTQEEFDEHIKYNDFHRIDKFILAQHAKGHWIAMLVVDQDRDGFNKYSSVTFLIKITNKKL